MRKAEPATEPAEMELAEGIGAEPGQAPAETEENETGDIRVTFGEPEADAEAIKAKAEEVKLKIAQQVRGDSQQLSLLTTERTIAELDDDLRYGRIGIGAILAEMAADDRFADIKAITTATGLVFVYSDTHIAPEDAVIKSLVEEGKSIIVNMIRGDSRYEVKLTPKGLS